MEELIKSLSSFLPTYLPLSLTFFGLRMGLKFVYKKQYEELSLLIQNRIFVKYMNDDLLKDCLYILKKEKIRRLKLKINKFLKFNLFKIYD